jgi:hypothetical protein
MNECLSEIFGCYFVIPEVPGWLSKLAFFSQICDLAFADAVRTEGRISAQRLTEAETLCRTYLAFYLPTWLPARRSAT